MTVKVHFDGKVLVPDEPVNLPVDRALTAHFEPAQKLETSATSLKGLLDLANRFPANGGPSDGAAQHDHYLYGFHFEQAGFEALLRTDPK